MKGKAWAAVRRYALLQQGDRVCVALSGGADSVSLLHFLLSCAAELHLQLSACHLNHGLRGQEAQRDEQFVRSLCRQWHIPLTVEYAPVREFAAQHRISEEEAGRRLRYALFERIAAEQQCKIATAHTLTDSMETTVFQLARGTGIRGLRGIPAKRNCYIRPLIDCTRREVEEYCRQNALEYVTDSTNLQPEYTRNKIRLEILPKFYELNPAADAAFARMQQSAQECYALVEQLTREFISAQVQGGRVPVQQFLCQPGILRREILAILAQQQGAALSAVHTRICQELAERGGAVEVGAGVRFVCRQGFIWFEQAGQPEQAQSWSLSVPLEQWRSGTQVLLPDSRKLYTEFFQCEQSKNFEKQIKYNLKNTLDCGKIYGNIVLRSRCSGDTLTLPGRGVTKTLKKLFNEAKISPRLRNRIVVAADEKGVIWVEGFGPDARVSLSQTGQVQDGIIIGIEERTT